MALSLNLLGEFALRNQDGAELTLPTRKTRALLAYLAVNADKPQRRERLMALLWGDRGEQQARQSLNQALRSIRKVGEQQGVVLIDSDSGYVILRSDALESDIDRHQSLFDDHPDVGAAHYSAELLEGLSVPEPAFETWLLAARSEFQTHARTALERAVKAATDANELRKAIDYANRLVALDPLREDSHRILMSLLSENGDRSAALRQYRIFSELLEKELQIKPDSKTEALYEKIREGPSHKARPEQSSSLQRLPLVKSSDRPSIAVLPFDNLGDDPKVDHLASGLMEDLITALAKVREMIVIDRHSTETYKGQSVNVQEVAKSLGVRYVLEGSVRTHGDSLRCSVQLVDAEIGHHIWAERYDNLITDVFALQDEIVRHILVELQVRLTEGDGARIASRGTRNLEAWLLRVQGAAELGRITREGAIRARELFEAAHRADPNWARPLGGIAFTHYYEARTGWSAKPDESIARGIDYAERAIAMDPNEPFGYMALRGLNVLLGNFDEAMALCKKAVSLAPNDQLAVGSLATQFLYMDDAAKSVEIFEHAVRLGPNLHRALRRIRGLALLLAGNIGKASEVLTDLVGREPEATDCLAQLAAVLIVAGQDDEACATTRKLLELDPTYTATRYLMLVNFQNPARTDWLRTLLVRAGLPE